VTGVARVLCVGSAVQDFVFSVNTMPTAAEKYRATGFDSMGGGPAATAAVAIARLGGEAVLASRLGNDPISSIIIDELQAYGVDCTLVKRFPNVTSPLSCVFVDAEGERLIMNYLDPEIPDPPDWLPASLPDSIDAVLADTRWPRGALQLLEAATRAGVPALLDADVPVPSDGALVNAATHVAFSTPGLAGFCGIDDVSSALQSVGRQSAAWCAVTLGRRGVMYIEDSGLQRLGAYTVSAKDTLGAGDVWHGAFALALAEGQSMHHALKFASAAAAVKVRDGGGRAGTPTREEVEEFMQSNSPEAVTCP
jgi:sulfofructose kinase